MRDLVISGNIDPADWNSDAEGSGDIGLLSVNLS